MYIDLFGEKRYEPRDVANKIVIAALNENFVVIKETAKGIRFVGKNVSGNFEQLSFFDTPGLYAIYKGKKCLYVGLTAYSVYNRIYRFQKHLQGRSRDDENHPAAEKARRDGLKTLHNTKMKFFPMKSVKKIIRDVSKIDSDYLLKYKNFPIDEYIAPLVKAKYNTRKASM